MDPIQRAIRIVNETDPGWWGELVDSLTKEEIEALRSNTGHYVWVDRDDPILRRNHGQTNE